MARECLFDIVVTVWRLEYLLSILRNSHVVRINDSVFKLRRYDYSTYYLGKCTDALSMRGLSLVVFKTFRIELSG